MVTNSFGPKREPQVRYMDKKESQEEGQGGRGRFQLIKIKGQKQSRKKTQTVQLPHRGPLLSWAGSVAQRPSQSPAPSSPRLLSCTPCGEHLLFVTSSISSLLPRSLCTSELLTRFSLRVAIGPQARSPISRRRSRTHRALPSSATLQRTKCGQRKIPGPRLDIPGPSDRL